MPQKVLNPAVMRVVSHPLRQSILVEMWDSGTPMRATDLAALLDEPVNLISYHVRQLRDAGFLVDAEGPSDSTARDRWYVAVDSGIVNNDETVEDARLNEASAAVLRTRYAQVGEEVISAQTKNLRPQFHMDGPIWLSQALAVEYIERLNELVDEMREKGIEVREAPDAEEQLIRFTQLIDLVPQTRHGEVLVKSVSELPPTK